MASRATPREQQPDWTDLYWGSADNLRLHARDYAGPDGGTLPPVLCMPGLTRNARDFEGLAPHIAKRRRVLAIDFRGRGDSAYDREAGRYLPPTYAADVIDLIDQQGIDRCVAIGTSLGGLVTMMLAAMRPGLLAGAVLNDVGPELGEEGLARIRGYVGQQSAHPSWVHCARAMAADHGSVYPGWTLEDWLVFAKRTHRLTPEGRIVADYDSAIATPFRQPGGETGADMWPLFDALKTVPTLIVRGGNSDILSAKVARKMAGRIDDAALVVIARTGHAPTLDEPESRSAIDALLARTKA